MPCDAGNLTCGHPPVNSRKYRQCPHQRPDRMIKVKSTRNTQKTIVDFGPAFFHTLPYVFLRTLRLNAAGPASADIPKVSE